MIDLIQINKMMDGRQFIGGDIGLQNIFEHLIREIRGLRCEGDSFTEPDINLPFAWRRGFKLYLELRAREQTPPDPAVVEDGNRSAAMERSWQQFVRDHALLLQWKGSGELGVDTQEYLGLRDGDLDPLTSNDPEALRFGGRRTNWGAVARRAREAVVRWENMAAREKQEIGHRVHIARLEKAIASAFASIEARVTALEAKLAYGGITGTLSSAGDLNGHNRSTEGKQS
jgi:hypothetical protein